MNQQDILTNIVVALWVPKELRIEDESPGRRTKKTIWPRCKNDQPIKAKDNENWKDIWEAQAQQWDESAIKN